MRAGARLLTVVVVVLTAQSLQTLRTPNVQQSAAIVTLPSAYNQAACTAATVAGTQLANLGNETAAAGTYLTNIDYSLSVYASASASFATVGANAGTAMKAQLDTIFAGYSSGSGFADSSYTNNWGGLNTSYYSVMDASSGACVNTKVPDPVSSDAVVNCLTNSNISICVPDNAGGYYHWVRIVHRCF